MGKKWVSSLVLGVFILAGAAAPVFAALNQGNFNPCGSSRSIPTDSNKTYYSIKKGDTLWDISRQFDVDVKTVMTLNNLDSNSMISVGQVLEIPYSRARMHTISKGDTLWDIALKYDTSLDKLNKANAGINPKNLKIGDKLVIPDSSFRTTVAVTATPSRGYSLDSPSILAWPVYGEITSPYGWRSSGYHHGVDIAGDIGDSIKAAAAGKVVFADYKAVYGRTVTIRHPDGKETVYAHAQRLLVKPGDYVVRGQKIATIGMTGRTTGPHLHFEVKIDDKTQNPLKYLRY